MRGLQHPRSGAAMVVARAVPVSSISGLPSKDYQVRGTELRINYLSSDAGSKILHVFTIN